MILVKTALPLDHPRLARCNVLEVPLPRLHLADSKHVPHVGQAMLQFNHTAHGSGPL